MPFAVEKLEWCGYTAVKKFWRYVCFDTIHQRDRHTHTHTHTHRHRMTAKTRRSPTREQSAPRSDQFWEQRINEKLNINRLANCKNENENGNGNWPTTMQLLLQATAHGATAWSVHSSCPFGTLDILASALYTDCSCTNTMPSSSSSSSSSSSELCNFAVRCSFENVRLEPEITKIGNFWYKSAPNGYTPLSKFHKIRHGEGVPGPHPHAKLHRCSFKNVGLRPPKLPEKND